MSALPLAQNPAIAEIYTEHAHQVTVAKYSPSGFYIASGGEQPKQTSTEDFPVCHLPSCPHYVLLLINIYILWYIITSIKLKDNAAGDIIYYRTCQKCH